MPLFPRDLADLFGLRPQVPNPGLGNGGLGPRPAQGTLAQEPRSSAGPRVTAREAKAKAEHGSASQKGLPLSRAKELGHPSSPGLSSDKEMKEGFRKIRAALWQLAEEHLEPEDIEHIMEGIKNRRKNNRFLQLPETVEPGDEARISLPPIDGTASGVQKKHPGGALKKKVLRKQDSVSLPPIVHGDASVPSNSSVLQPCFLLSQQGLSLRGSQQLGAVVLLLPAVPDGSSLPPSHGLQCQEGTSSASCATQQTEWLCAADDRHEGLPAANPQQMVPRGSCLSFVGSLPVL
nr:uncharacterized protein LOC121469609 [Taeniopygia guttata]